MLITYLTSFQITLEKKELAKAGERNISILQNEINRRRKVTNIILLDKFSRLKRRLCHPKNLL